ncbi:MAG: GEVED domain-containing protein [Flavipsychrobacter sp.]
MNFARSIAIRIAYVLAIVFISVSMSNAQSYCIPTYTLSCSGSTFIDNVTTTGAMTNIINNNTGCGNTAASYSDYTGNTTMKVIQDAGSSVTVNVKMGPLTGPSPCAVCNYISRIQIYVDWNQNGSFSDPGELVGAIPALTGSGSAGNLTFSVPLSAKHGVTRMRVRAASRKSVPELASSFDPCANHQEGEAEDYNFEVINPCLPPTNLSSGDVNYKSANIKWNSKGNAKLYEYYFTNDKSTIPPTSVGYKYTTDTSMLFSDLVCDTQYYFYLRSICDTTGSTIFWDTSSWTLDSFRTDPCCYNPNVSIQNITSTTAVASWSPIKTAYGYEYLVSTSPVIPVSAKGTYTTYTSAFLQGLSGGVQYYLHVRSRCTPTPLSEWNTTGLLTQPPLSVNATIGDGTFEISIFPNPVSSILSVDIKGEIGANAILEILDMTGRVLKQKSVTVRLEELNVSELPSGIFIIKYQDDQKIQQIKINKQ